jgi:hypothetical protein
VILKTAEMIYIGAETGRGVTALPFEPDCKAGRKSLGMESNERTTVS